MAKTKELVEELVYTLTGLAGQAQPVIATSYVVDKFNTKYAYDWKWIEKNVAITFTGFKVANPYSNHAKELGVDRAWHLLCAQVCVFNRSAQGKSGLFRNIYIDERDERWRSEQSIASLVQDAERLVKA